MKNARAARQAREAPRVTPKRGDQAAVRGRAPPAEPYLNAGGDVFGGYRFYVFFQILETDPASARGRREQQHTILTADQVALIARERCLHRDVGAEEMALVGGRPRVARPSSRA